MVKSFAFYLPQFHSCDANDAFWGKDFTDWVTTRNNKPLYPEHAQPKRHLLGEYDLSNPDHIKRQCEIAKKYLLNGFAIYHYWFDTDQRALFKPINFIRDNPALGIEYFISWVNTDWTMSWIGKSKMVIRKQSYNDSFYRIFVNDLVTHFAAPHYYKINGKPVFYIHKPADFDIFPFLGMLNDCALEKGFPGVYLIAPECHLDTLSPDLFDAIIGYPPGDFTLTRIRSFSLLRKTLLLERLKSAFNRRYFRHVRTIHYPTYIKRYFSWINRTKYNDLYIPTVLNGWDNTPRYGVNGFEFTEDTPTWQRYAYEEALKFCARTEKPFFLIKSWNEWAEGNTLEPCNKHGWKKLESLRTAISSPYQNENPKQSSLLSA